MQTSNGQSSPENSETSSVAALAEELRETTKMLKEGSFSPQATIRFDSGGMGAILSGVAAFSALAMLIIMIVVVIWMNGQIIALHQQLTDLNNNDRVHDAYLRQYGDRLSKVESQKDAKPAK